MKSLHIITPRFPPCNTMSHVSGDCIHTNPFAVKTGSQQHRKRNANGPRKQPITVPMQKSPQHLSLPSSGTLRGLDSGSAIFWWKETEAKGDSVRTYAKKSVCWDCLTLQTLEQTLCHSNAFLVYRIGRCIDIGQRGFDPLLNFKSTQR